MTLNRVDIAVVGVSCRFPDADGYRQFWTNLVSGMNSIREIPPDRWNVQDYYSPDVDEAGKSNSKWCGSLDNVYDFDHRFFHLSPREAVSMDPQHRLLLEETWRCIEDSGIPLRLLQERVTSVYAGIMSPDYLQKLSGCGASAADSYACLGTYESLLANRISYAFHLRGTSMPINAACASSLVAVHEARRALLQGECDYAFASAVNLNLHPLKYVSFSKSRMLSPDGQCKTFDKDANGYVPGDGVGVLLLQRLDQAVEEGNRIYGIVKGSAVNHVGKSPSITAPKVQAQRDVILSAYKSAGIRPETVTYVEAHGTGTSLGDPIEVEALTQAFRQDTGDCGFCKIGSVKTNIGHLESAAGMAGIIKVLMMMKHRTIPASLNVKVPNPIIDFAATPFEIATESSEWRSREEGQPLRAGVSSFGFGGVNAHVLLEQYKEAPNAAKKRKSKSGKADASAGGRLFVLSAKSEESLKRIIADWKQWTASAEFMNEVELDDLCMSVLMGRESFQYRVGGLVESKQDICALLEQNAGISRAAERLWCLHVDDPKWQGYRDIGWNGAESVLLKRKEEQFIAVLRKLGIESGIARGFYDNTWSGEYRELYLFAAGYIHASALMELGWSPACAAGSKSGAWVSLAVSGMLSLDDIVAVLTGHKKRDDLQPGRPSIPLYRSGGQMLMPYAFDEAYVEKIVCALRHIADNRYDGVHAQLMDKAKQLYANQYTFKTLMDEWHTAIQSVTGANSKRWLDEGAAGVTEAAELSNPAEAKRLLMLMIASSIQKLNRKWDLQEQRQFDHPPFYELLDLLADDVITKQMAVRLAADGRQDFREAAAVMNRNWSKIKPGRPYSVIKEHSRLAGVAHNNGQWLESFIHADDDTDQILSAAAAQMEAGAPITCLKLDRPFMENALKLWLCDSDMGLTKLNSDKKYAKISLPLYAFQRKTFRLSNHRSVQGAGAEGDVMLHPLLHRNRSGAHTLQFSSVFSGREFFLADHQVKGSMVLPGAAYLEMAGAAVRQAGGLLAQSQEGFTLRNVVWMNPIRVGQEAVTVHTALYPDNNGDIRYEIYYEEPVDNRTVVCGCGRASIQTGLAGANLNLSAVQTQGGGRLLSAAACYERLRKLGLEYGPSHQGIQEMYLGREQALAKLALPSCIWETGEQYRLHPSLLDAALQAAILFADGDRQSGDAAAKPPLPFALDTLELIRPCTPRMWAYIRFSSGSSRGDKVEYLDIDMCDESGACCVRINRYTSRNLEGELPQRPFADNAPPELPEDTVLLTPVWDSFRLTADVAPAPINDRMIIIGGNTHDWNAIQKRYPGALAMDGAADYTEDELAHKLEACGPVDHLLWIAPASPGDTEARISGEAMIMGQQRGVIQLFRLVKSLLRIGYGSKPLQWTVLTFQTQPVHKADRVDPVHAGVHGLVGSLAKEYPGWGIRLADLEAGADRPWEELFALQADPAGGAFVYRGKQWHKRVLVPVACPAPSGSAYRRGGAYVVIGGAGGLGTAWSEYMIRTYQARIFWIGRREKDTDIEASLQRLARHGPAPQYICADAANPEDLHRAYQTIKERCTRIHGVIHAAIALLDSSIMKMDESRFRAGLVAKADVCVSIDLVFRHDDLDFVLFFSSMNSFATPPGQSNYAAGCAFKDAFAQWLAHERPYAVKVINWGYWGSVGAVASGDYRKRMAKMGIGSVEQPEAMLALELLLGGPLHQLGLIKTEGERDPYHIHRRELVTVYP
ncbi:SDR family NAD(P)-dependent oxidoreductase [Paenibacillus ehimensis]|uniref:SDR family NAD(P)-dependent oxidoreductase n=1 Tax=Paenibacillus ehimensis TaxID=79264 RepID=UPI000FDAA972|nr:SDR family NAD(P)-dependent oxidoreductase [Paenibacillus ehimensis]